MNTVYCILPVHQDDNYSHLMQCLKSIDNLIVPKDIAFFLYIGVDGNLPTELENSIYQYKRYGDKICQIFSSTVRKGLAANLNNVIQSIDCIEGVFIMRMDADDIMEPERLIIQLQFLQENPSIDIVSSCATKIDTNGKKIGYQEHIVGQVYPGHTWKNPIIHPSVLIRSEFFMIHGLYNERFKYAQDWELWARACRSGAKFAVLPQRLLRFRLNRNSIYRRKETQFYVLKIALYHLRGTKVKLLVVVRSLIIFFLPVPIIKKFLNL
ncbi:MAG: hypothetical protein CMM15_10155 [Rhodospirillaceae bacterium]|nr:hypothetical protein [Rhodospirillaceae bacterium]OUU21869.1 MAG: hypothetical protein CBB97_15800 [Candidatus Endolissoclinum sp. TMED37]